MAGDPVIVAVFSDTHVNSTVGLVIPRITLDDGGTYSASKGQRWIWSNWNSFWRDVEAEKRRLKARVVCVGNGDLADNNGHKTTQLITKNEADITRMAYESLMPAIDVADTLFITRGTEVHTGPSSSMEEKIAYDLSAEKCPTGSHSWWELPLQANRTKFNFAHHAGTATKISYNTAAVAGRIAARALFSYANSGLEPPDIMIRSHNHVFSDSGHNYRLRAIVTPCWQLTTSYGYRIGGSVLPVGGVMFICRGKDDVETHVRQYMPQRDKYVTV